MDRIKKMFCALVLFVIMNIGLANAMVFPIAIDDCLMSRGRVELTGWYNQTRYDDNDGTTRKHKALDIPCVLGTAVISARAGEVIEFGFDRPKYCRVTKRWKCGYGNYVKIEDNDGRTHIYGHLSKYEVKLHQKISEGQIFAYVGSTGLVSKTGKVRFGNHLHYEVRNRNGRKISVTTQLGRVVKPFIKDQKTKYAFSLR